ncbi:TPA: DUF4158 domain-containing protein [Escherichia coli]|nr:DUF4158 domain-containing protein [Escherichia coli]
MGEISVKTGNNARNGGKNSLNRLIRCVCGKKIGPDPRNFNQRVNLGRNDLLIRTFPSFNLIFDDMQFISTQVQGGKGIRPFSINKMQRDRIYQRILRLLNYQKWDESLHFAPLYEHLVMVGKAWLEPRYLFDAAAG